MAISCSSWFVLLACASVVLTETAACRAPDDTSDSTAALAEAPQPRAGGQMFLTAKGSSDRDEALEYYAKIGIPRETIEGHSYGGLANWLRTYVGDAPTLHSVYFGNRELYLHRDMTCTKVVARGVGGCWVTNTVPGATEPPSFTVAMNISPEGFARFYAFTVSGNGAISPFAEFDGESFKYLPRVCTVCHGGAIENAKRDGDMGSVFREFEPSFLNTYSQNGAEELYELNQIVRSANSELRTDAEGAPPGTDDARRAVNGHIDDLYRGLGNPASHSAPPFFHAVDSETLVPSAWQQDRDSKDLWTKVINPYCMGCHRASTFDWSSSWGLEYLRSPDPQYGVRLRRYVPGALTKTATPYMPQSERGALDLDSDQAARSALDRDWRP